MRVSKQLALINFAAFAVLDSYFCSISTITMMVFSTLTSVRSDNSVHSVISLRHYLCLLSTPIFKSIIVWTNSLLSLADVQTAIVIVDNIITRSTSNLRYSSV